MRLIHPSARQARPVRLWRRVERCVACALLIRPAGHWPFRWVDCWQVCERYAPTGGVPRWGPYVCTACAGSETDAVTRAVAVEHTRGCA